MCVLFVTIYFFFVFKQKPEYEMLISDWSSYVCASYLRSLSGCKGNKLYGSRKIKMKVFLDPLFPCFLNPSLPLSFNQILNEQPASFLVAECKDTHYSIPSKSFYTFIPDRKSVV